MEGGCEKCGEGKCCGHKKWHKCGGCSGAIYGLGFIGAAIYYLQASTTFWAGVLGVLKALVWPAFLIYAALGALHL